MANTAQVWKDFYEAIYTNDFPNLSHILGSDWRIGQFVNATSGQYKKAAYQAMLNKFGQEPDEVYDAESEADEHRAGDR